MENTNDKYLNSTNSLQRITSLAEIHWVCCGLASWLLPSQPFLIQLTQDVLEGQLRQGRMLHQLPWFPAVSRSHPTPRILQMQVLAVCWWAVFHAGIPETGVWGVWSGRVRCGMGKVHLLCWCRVQEARLAGVQATFVRLQGRLAPQRWQWGGLATWLGPQSLQCWASVASQLSSLLRSKHGAVV